MTNGQKLVEIGFKILHRRILGYHISLAYQVLRGSIGYRNDLVIFHTVCSANDRFSKPEAHRILLERVEQSNNPWYLTLKNPFTVNLYSLEQGILYYLIPRITEDGQKFPTTMVDRATKYLLKAQRFST